MNKAYHGGRKLLGESMMFNILDRQTRQWLMYINKKKTYQDKGHAITGAGRLPIYFNNNPVLLVYEYLF